MKVEIELKMEMIAKVSAQMFVKTFPFLIPYKFVLVVTCFETKNHPHTKTIESIFYTQYRSYLYEFNFKNFTRAKIYKM